jgi:hypothetical protein
MVCDGGYFLFLSQYYNLHENSSSHSIVQSQRLRCGFHRKYKTQQLVLWTAVKARTSLSANSSSPRRQPIASISFLLWNHTTMVSCICINMSKRSSSSIVIDWFYFQNSYAMRLDSQIPTHPARPLQISASAYQPSLPPASFFMMVYIRTNSWFNTKHYSV